MEWYAHVTVATIVERDGKFLLVEEQSDNGLVFNQPAGHLEKDETLQQAAIRETLEETGWSVALKGVVGIGLYTAPTNGVTYQRVTFYAESTRHHPERELDTGIIGARWLSLEEIRAQSDKLRSPLVLEVIQRYLDGHRYPLEMIY